MMFISRVESSRQASKQELFPFLRKSNVLHHLTGIPIFAYSPDVEFCGYSIPHPSEAVMNLRIQTWGESNNPDSDPDPLRANIPSSRRENGGLTLRFLFPFLPVCTDNVSVFAVLRKALDDLEDLCDVVEDKFTTARDQFNAEHPDRVSS
jgi:DNA-directed RNA polymerase I and III subunit RPAC2